MQGGEAGRRRHGEIAMGDSETFEASSTSTAQEDYRFLTGAGRFTDDVSEHRQTWAYFLRSPHAHARIRGIDQRKGEGCPRGGRDLHRPTTGRHQRIAVGWLITGTRRQRMNEPAHPVLRKEGALQSATAWRWSSPKPGPGKKTRRVDAVDYEVCRRSRSGRRAESGRGR